MPPKAGSVFPFFFVYKCPGLPLINTMLESQTKTPNKGHASHSTPEIPFTFAKMATFTPCFSYIPKQPRAQVQGSTEAPDIGKIEASINKISDHWKELWHLYYDQYKIFHKEPELSGEEFETVDKIAKFLDIDGPEDPDKVPSRWIRNFGSDRSEQKPNLVGVLENWHGDKPDSMPVVLLRADMDGLPILEAKYVIIS
jgi:hypothetical protein